MIQPDVFSPGGTKQIRTPVSLESRKELREGHVPALPKEFHIKNGNRNSPQTIQVLADFLRQPKDWKYGYNIGQNTGLKSGTLYPILMRLAEQGILATRWEQTEPGKPPRHMYRLTADGLRYAREQVPRSSKQVRARPALAE
jgi:PadR family transcriptional regulator PadR